MKEISKKYKEEIKKILSSRAYIITTIIVMILGYGYFISHVTVGMDDTCLDRYYGSVFSSGNMLGTGRWGSYLLYKILSVTTFTPFWLETLSILILYATTILISSFIRKNIKKEDIKFSIVFSCIYMSYSLINEPFIFQPSNLALMLGNLLTILSVIMIYEVFANKINRKYYLLVLPILTFAISMYEACCQTFLVGILACVIIEMLKEKRNNKEILKYFTINIVILILSIVLYYFVLYVFYFVGIPNQLKLYVDRDVSWFEYGIINGISIVSKQLYHNIVEVSKYYFPVLEFLIASIIGIVISIGLSIKKKNIYFFDVFILMIFANLALAILQCQGVLYRACISWNLFVAVVFTFTYAILMKRKYLKAIATVFIILIILWQTRDLNQWFYSEYMRYEKDLKEAYQIADEIVKEVTDLQKPVVFVGMPNPGSWRAGQKGAQSNGLSVIWWGQKAFGDNSYELIKFINSLGYNFRKPTDEQYQKGQEISKDMNNFPKDGYVKEFDDIIVVKFK